MSEEELSSATSESSIEDTPSEAGSEPTPDEQIESIHITTQWLDNFHLGSDMAPGNSTIGTPANGNGGTIKVNPPIRVHHGRRDQIKSFQLAMQVVLGDCIPEKVIEKQCKRQDACLRCPTLRGKALEWIQPHMEDYIDQHQLEEDLKDSNY